MRTLQRPSVLIFSCLLIATALDANASRVDVSESSTLEAREEAVDLQILTGERVAAFGGAVDILRERIAQSGPRSPKTYEALRRVGIVLLELDYELADAVWQIARVAASETMGPCSPQVAESIHVLGATAKWTATNFDDMLPYYREAASMLDRDVPEERVLLARIVRGEGCYNWYRYKDRSIAMLEEALHMQLDTPGEGVEAATTRAWLGWTLLQLGRHDEARFHLETARGELESAGLGQRSIVGTIESALADLDMLDGDWATAEAGYLRAIERYKSARRLSSTRFSDIPLHGYNRVALAQLKQGRSDEAWTSLQYYRGMVGKRLATLGQWKRRSPDSYERVRAVRTQVVSHRDLRCGRETPLVLSDVRWDAVLTELEANARLFQLEAEYYAPEVARSTELADLRALLPENYAYIGWLESRVGDELLSSRGRILDSRWMYVIRPNRPVRWIPIWESTRTSEHHQLRRDAAHYVELMQRASEWALRIDDDPNLTSLARRLAAQEFNAALPFLDGVDHLVVEFVEDRAGCRPIEALILPDGGYLGDRFAVAYSPSAETYVTSHAPRSRRDDESGVLVIGDPIFHADAADKSLKEIAIRGGDRSVRPLPIDRTLCRAATNRAPDALDELPRLPQALAEIEHIQRLFSRCTTLSGADATEENVRRIFTGPDASRFRIVHVATHALTESWLSQRHALALSRRGVDGSPSNDGVVDALEIQLSWNLAGVDLVTLSGCATAAAPYWSRGEPGGLSTTLLAAGVRSVVANLWPIDDLAAAQLVSRFYWILSESGEEATNQGVPPVTRAAALAEAKRWLRNFEDASGRKPFAHPVYWSGFVLIGAPE